MESEQWKKEFLKVGADQIGAKKGDRPVLKGAIVEYKGKNQVALWGTDTLRTFIKDSVKEAIEEMR